MSSLLNQDIRKFLGLDPFVDGVDHTSPTKFNPAYDFGKGGVQYEQLPDGTFIGPNDTIIMEDAPTNLGRVWAGLRDKLTDNKHDYDGRGPGLDKWGRRIAAPNTIGGVPIQIKPEIPNEKYNPAKATNPVPNIGSGLSAGKFIQDAYSGWRDNRMKDREREQNLLYNKIANKFAFDLDKAGMYNYMSSPRGMAETSLLLQQAGAIPRIAKAELIKAIAERKIAASTPQEAAAKMYSALKTTG